MSKYTMHPCRDVGGGEIERCEACEADMFTIYRIEADGTEAAHIDYEFEDSVEMVSQWANATRELERLNRSTP